MLRAILFDLDDTLFDHSYCARVALETVYRAHVCFSAQAFDEFVSTHAEHLETLHSEVLAGAINLDAARVERFRRLLLSAGGGPDQAAGAAAMYREGYVGARRAVRGAADLLAELRSHAPIVIVSNNLLGEQRDKLEYCGLAQYVDALVVSEEAGVPKPDPEIFRQALQAVRVSPAEAVMVGDSWTADVAGAHAAGIVPIWFNPRGLPAPDSPGEVLELRAFEPVRATADTILHALSSRANRD